jgi:hypothetical protein
VTGGGVSGSDMPSFPWTARQDVSPAEDASLAALLAGEGLSAGADPELRPVADVLVALTARSAGDELTGLAAARAEFRRHVVMPAQGRHSAHRRPGGLVSRLGVKAAATAALVVMALGGAAAVAYAGALPGSWQQFAHRTIGAPMRVADHETPAGAPTSGPAAHQPCAAYQRALAHGTASQQRAAVRNLVKAAGGPGKVTAWCAAVPRSSHPAAGPQFSGPLAGRGVPRHSRPPHHAVPPATWPFGHHGSPPGPAGTHTVPRPGLVGRSRSLPLPRA